MKVSSLFFFSSSSSNYLSHWTPLQLTTTTKMANEDEEDFYENLEADVKKHRYDEITINFGRPVILDNAGRVPQSSFGGEGDIFNSVSFTSPIQDLQHEESSRTPPIPAPRLSKLRSQNQNQNCDNNPATTTDNGYDTPKSLDPTPKLDSVESREKSVDDIEDLFSDNNSSGEILDKDKACNSDSNDVFVSLGQEDNNFVDEIEAPASETLEVETRRLPPPDVPPRNTILLPNNIKPYENVYTDIDHDDAGIEIERKNSSDAGARPKAKASTIDIRNQVHEWYEEATLEVERDLSLDLSVLEEKSNNLNQSVNSVSSRGRNSYEHIAIENKKVNLVEGKIVPQAPTLLRDFDPILLNNFEGNTAVDQNDPDHDEAETPDVESAFGPGNSREENLYVAVPFLGTGKVKAKSRTSKDLDDFKRALINDELSKEIVGVSVDDPNVEEDRESLPPPSMTPPPLPTSDPPALSTSDKVVKYENVWIGEDNKPQVIFRPPKPSSPSPESSPAVPPRLNKNKPPVVNPSVSSNSSVSSSSAAVSVSSFKQILSKSNSGEAESSSNKSGSATSSCNDVNLLAASASVYKPALPHGCGGPPQRSFSALNLASKFASNIKRKMSDQNMALSPRIMLSSSSSRRRSSALLEHGVSSSTHNHFKMRSGVLYVYSRSRRAFQPKWCILGNGDFRYFNDKTIAVPKESVPINAILSLRKHEHVSFASPSNVEIHTFDISYIMPSGGGKHTILTLGATTYNEREKWMDKLIQSLDFKLTKVSPTFVDKAEMTRLTWVNLKTGFAGQWHKSWISLCRRQLQYTCAPEELFETHGIDLKKVKNVTLVREVKNLVENPASSHLPVLVVDCLDRSLYLQSTSEKEAVGLKEAIEAVAFSNSNHLDDQQLTSEDVPVIVEKCVSFVYGHGCMTEGIYRHSGVNTKINRLLEMFKANAWAVHLTREAFSEHDVANALKRFFRTLKEPLLTEKLRPLFLQAAAVDDHFKKVDRLRNLLKLLPDTNYNTLKKLLSHLVAIADQAGKNLMPNYNLSAIWVRTKLKVFIDTVFYS